MNSILGITLKSVLSAAILAVAQAAHAEPDPAAKAYLDEALTLIKLHHRDSAKANWPEILARAQKEIADAKVPSDTYSAIQNMLVTLGERHSFFVAPSKIDTKIEPMEGKRNSSLMPAWRLEADHFALLTLPGLVTFDDTEGKKAFQYHMTAREGLIQMDKNSLCGWIIDLRGNTGGNMWPMLWGLDPLLGVSPFGAFPAKNGKAEKWVRANGYIYPTSESVEETPPSFQLKQADAPVAVLIGPQTASSGEMTAIAFIGRKNSRLFGSPSAGLTSANKTFKLSDGAALILTAAGVADRNGHEYIGPITPDEVVDSAAAIPAAKKWLEATCGNSFKNTMR
jgi:carboxyl-terminal processing protease